MRRIPLKTRILPGARRSFRQFRTDLSGVTTRAPRLRSPFHAAPVGHLSGSARIGAAIVEGRISHFGQTHQTALEEAWTQPLPSLRFAEWFHSFKWLYDLAALDASGDARANKAIQTLTEAWVAEYGRYHSFAWRADILASRVLALALAGFPALDGSETAKSSLLRQSRFLARNLRRLPKAHDNGLSRIRALAALAATALRSPDADSLYQTAEREFPETLSNQVFADGGHISRCPEASIAVWSILKPLDSLLDSRGRPAIASVSRTLDRVAPTVGFYSHTDGGLATFHGGGEGDRGTISHIAATTQSKPFAFAPQTHYQRLAQGGTIVFVDVGEPAPYPYDTAAHVSPLAFEMSTPSGRLVVSCAWSDEQPQRWRAPVRGLPAHSALSLSDATAARFADIHPADVTLPHIVRAPGRVTATRREAEPGTLVEGSHDGFVKSCGIVHSRRLFLDATGRDLRGEDSLSVPGSSVPHLAAGQRAEIRFHLHPDVEASHVPGSAKVVLHHGTENWVFGMSGPGCTLSLEPTAYLGEGNAPQPSTQIVVRSDGTANTDLRVRWAFRQSTSRQPSQETGNPTESLDSA